MYFKRRNSTRGNCQAQLEFFWRHAATAQLPYKMATAATVNSNRWRHSFLMIAYEPPRQFDLNYREQLIIIIVIAVVLGVVEWPLAIACFVAVSIVLTAAVLTCRCAWRHIPPVSGALITPFPHPAPDTVRNLCLWSAIHRGWTSFSAVKIFS